MNWFFFAGFLPAGEKKHTEERTPCLNPATGKVASSHHMLPQGSAETMQAEEQRALFDAASGTMADKPDMLHQIAEGKQLLLCSFSHLHPADLFVQL